MCAEACRIGDYAIEPDGCERECHPGEYGKQQRDDAPGGKRLGGQVRHAHYMRNCLISVHRPYLALRSPRKAGGIASRVDREAEQRSRELGEGQVYLSGRARYEPELTHVPNYADNLQRLLDPLDDDPSADRVVVWHEAAGQAGTENRNLVRTLGIPVGEYAAFEQRDLHGAKIVGCN